MALVGHSWGGDTALDVGYNFRQRTIGLIVTLDAVGAFTSWVCQPPHVRRWINVYVDNTVPTGDNLVADFGGHYGHREGADANIDLGRQTTHGDAMTMFSRVETDVATFESHRGGPGNRRDCHR